MTTDSPVAIEMEASAYTSTAPTGIDLGAVTGYSLSPPVPIPFNVGAALIQEGGEAVLSDEAGNVLALEA